MLNYKIFGHGEPIVVLHGFLGSLDNWLSIGKKFAEKYQVILVDQRNHGKSFHDDNFNYEMLVTDLDSLLSSLKIEKPTLIGHSMGGKTVMQYSSYYSFKINKLIVADIGPKYYAPHHGQIIDALNAVPIGKLKSRQEAEKILSTHIEDAGVRAFLLKNIARTSEGFSWKMNLPVLSEKSNEIGAALNYLVPIETETLFLRGSNSNYIEDEDWEEIEEIFPNASLKTIKNAGHWLHAEQPLAFCDEVMRFLDKK